MTTLVYWIQHRSCDLNYVFMRIYEESNCLWKFGVSHSLYTLLYWIQQRSEDANYDFGEFMGKNCLGLYESSVTIFSLANDNTDVLSQATFMRFSTVSLVDVWTRTILDKKKYLTVFSFSFPNDNIGFECGNHRKVSVIQLLNWWQARYQFRTTPSSEVSSKWFPFRSLSDVQYYRISMSVQRKVFQLLC